MSLPSDNRVGKAQPYTYEGPAIRALQSTISPERLRTYLILASSDRRDALRLYVRNAALGGAFHGPLQTLEVTLRNAMNDAMTEAHGRDWLSGILLRPAQQEAVRAAKATLTRKRRPLETGRIVAELSLGFWTALLAKGYDASLWRPTLYACFAPPPARGSLHGELNRLRKLRNRIVHHEPILQRDLHADHDKILWILKMISPETAAWVDRHSRVREELARSSRSIGRF